VWKIAHRRWDIENGGFHFLKHHFHLGVCLSKSLATRTFVGCVEG
jgi:hypothetical protein